uniref:AlNc14C64G4608 protein n=1 Tax=Albugo laibachii Nc14 TaxID=890382 RepID=F0WD88_9STRA|nr:AlNc14C64G4608 [Albugo laibachii Nc14]|eukprot:CCA19160.1 AlNc14C64G4608 [Albugo laibachii Nc14]
MNIFDHAGETVHLIYTDMNTIQGKHFEQLNLHQLRHPKKYLRTRMIRQSNTAHRCSTKERHHREMDSLESRLLEGSCVRAPISLDTPVLQSCQHPDIFIPI